jgi:large subunit ribosomal protein L3
MKSLKTKKIQMTQIFDASGKVFPVTLLVAGEDISETFKEGEVVAVTGTSKGKGFQGVVKRHGFHGGPRSHGQKHSEREPGSIGGGGRDGGRVARGKRMAGRMGGETVTVLNLKVVKILPESKEIFVSGAVPGRRGSVVTLKQK